MSLTNITTIITSTRLLVLVLLWLSLIIINYSDAQHTPHINNNCKLEWFKCLLPLQQNMSPLGTFSPGVFWPGGFVRGVFCPGDFCLGGLCPFPQVQCLYAPSRLPVPSIVAWRTNKKNRQTRPPSSAGSWPPLPKFSGYVEVDAHYIFHRSTIWIRPLCTELGPKNPSKMPILPWSKRIYVALAAT